MFELMAMMFREGERECRQFMLTFAFLLKPSKLVIDILIRKENNKFPVHVVVFTGTIHCTCIVTFAVTQCDAI